MDHCVDILIPTFNRAAALAVTLTSLAAQSFRNYRVIISDQSDVFHPDQASLVATPINILRAHGHQVVIHRHLPRRGIAEQRQFLLEQSSAPFILFLDDDIILEPDLLARLFEAISEEECGFVGSAPIGLSHVNDRRPHEQAIEIWAERVAPEYVNPLCPSWDRHKLHNAANVYHVQKDRFPNHHVKYRVAWVGGCVLFNREKLQQSGGYDFWRELPREHAGEDVYAQLRVMAAFGGCAILPSGCYHLELPTTIPNRKVNVVDFYGWGRGDERQQARNF